MADGAKGESAGLERAPQSEEGNVTRIGIVSFFSGCGGLDLGFLGGFTYLNQFYPKLPFHIISAYDSDAKAVECYKQNIGDHAHVLDLAAADMSLLPAAKVLLGGFPCQEFSQCGPRKGLDSERGRLYLAMVDYAQRHQPDVIVGENVAGLKYLDGGKALDKIRSDFESVGYQLRVWEVHAYEHGVPQARHRLILVFVRNDLDAEELEALQPQKEKVTARDAIADLLRPGRTAILNQNQYFKAARAKNGHGQGDEKTQADGPAYTVRANSRSRVQFHYSRPRRLTVRECARLQTFPDNFVFQFDATANMRLIGNAVPPVLGYRVAEKILKFLSV